MMQLEYRGKERLTPVSLRQVRSLFEANWTRWIGDIPIMPLTHCGKPHPLGGTCWRTLDHPGRCKRSSRESVDAGAGA